MLVTCGECGKQISDKAQACPHCGNPMAEDPMIEWTQYRLNYRRRALFVMLLVGVFLMGIDLYHTGGNESRRHDFLVAGLIAIFGSGIGFVVQQFRQQKLDELKRRK